MVFASAIAVLLAAPFAQAVDPAGRWDCSANTPNGEQVPFQMTVSRQGGQFSVALKAPDRPEFTVPEATLEGDTLTFKVTVSEGNFTIRLRFSQDAFEGEWRGNEESGRMKGKRG